MSVIIEMMSYPFMQRAFIGGLLVALCAALLGVSLVLKRYSMIGDGLSHVSFGALSIAVACGFAPIKFSIPVVIIAAFFLLRMAENGKMHSDAAIAVVSASALAIGVIVTSLTTGLSTDVYSYMFGSVLAMSKDDVEMSVILSIIVLIVFDENFSKASGVKVNSYNTLISIFTAVTVVIGVKMMGAMLISSLIIFPSLTSMRVYKSFLSVTICSAVIAMINFIAGLIVSYVLSIPAGASVVVANLIMFVAFIIVGNILNVIRLRKYSK